MLITKRVMCRESRKLFEFLDELASKNFVQGLVIPAHIYVCDMLVCEFFTAPIQNVIKNKMEHMGKKTSRQFEITYWDSIIRLMLTDKGAMRNNKLSKELSLDAWDVLNGSLIVDYSIEDTILMNKIVANNSVANIKRACDIAKSMNASNIPYINAVLDRANAEQNIIVSNINNMITKIEKSNSLINVEVHEHSAIDIALAQYEFNKKKEDYELEQKLNELYGGI